MTEEQPDGTVGVVIVHFGEPAPTRACLAALSGDHSFALGEVVVVDNSGNLQDEVIGSAKVLHFGENRGYGAALNRGVAALTRDDLVALILLNNDVEIAGGFLGAAVDMLADHSVGVVGGPLYLNQQPGELWYGGGWVRFVSGTVAQERSLRAARQAREVGFVTGAAMAVSPRAWQRVGGFDERFFLYNEDLDFCLRMGRAGYRLWFCPAMGAIHRLGASTGSAARSPLYLEHITATRFLPFRPLIYRLYLAVLHSGYVVLRVLWNRLVIGGDFGHNAARALLTGYRRALVNISAGPKPV